MGTNTKTLAVEYYQLIGAKNREEIAKRLHPDVEFHGPLATLKGKESVLNAIVNFMNAITSLTIRAQFGEGEQAMIAYEVDMPPLVKNFPGASLLRFQSNLITQIQLFYDASLLQVKKDEIFSQQ